MAPPNAEIEMRLAQAHNLKWVRFRQLCKGERSNRVPMNRDSNLTPRITRPPAPPAEHNIPRVAGRVHAIVRLQYWEHYILFFNVFIPTADSIHSLDSERESHLFRFVEFIA